MPIGHGKQRLSDGVPEYDHVPAGQLVQVSEEVAATAVEYLPPSQGVQVELPDVDHVPGGPEVK